MMHGQRNIKLQRRCLTWKCWTYHSIQLWL